MLWRPIAVLVDPEPPVAFTFSQSGAESARVVSNYYGAMAQPVGPRRSHSPHIESPAGPLLPCATRVVAGAHTLRRIVPLHAARPESRMDGCTLGERLVESHPETRVLCISGSADRLARVRDTVDKVGPAFRLEPFTLNDLRRKMRVQLDIEAGRGPAQGRVYRPTAISASSVRMKMRPSETAGDETTRSPRSFRCRMFSSRPA